MYLIYCCHVNCFQLTIYFQKDKEVFLFNRRAIADVNFPSEDSVPPPVETTSNDFILFIFLTFIDVLFFIVPPIRPLSKEYESKPLIQALKTYEHQFHYHFVVAQVFLLDLDFLLVILCINNFYLCRLFERRMKGGYIYVKCCLVRSMYK